MSLFLIESLFNGTIHDQQSFSEVTKKVQAELSARELKVLEVQVSNGFERAFFIIEGTEDAIRESLDAANISISLLKEVRLVGKKQEDIQTTGEGLNYLVEWNLPETLTMDQYLERKKNNSPLYAEVPEVEFSRTYVCEDMTKCLCFYKAPDEASVKRAREAVKAPIDALTEILPQE